MPVLGPRLREMFAALLHVAKCLSCILVRVGRFESPGTFQGILRSRLIQGLANRLQVGLVASRNGVEVEEFHVVTTSIVVAADEPCILGNVDAFLAQALADLRPVGHGCKKPRVWTAATPSTSSAVVGRLVRIVE